MKKFEHIRILCYSEREQDENLIVMGKEGYELIAVVQNNTGGDNSQYHLYFKRELK